MILQKLNTLETMSQEGAQTASISSIPMLPFLLFFCKLAPLKKDMKFTVHGDADSAKETTPPLVAKIFNASHLKQ